MINILIAIAKKFAISTIWSKIKGNKTATISLVIAVILSLILGYGYIKIRGLNATIDNKNNNIEQLERTIIEREYELKIQNVKIQQLADKNKLLLEKRELSIKESEQIEDNKDRDIEEINKKDIPKTCEGGMDFLKEWGKNRK